MTEKFTVSEITGLIKMNLEGAFPSVLVEGEISGWKASDKGHCYFTLKDARAVLGAAIFANRAGRLRFVPRDGMLVRAKGSLSVYPPRGNYQLICDEIEVAGEGELLAKIEKLKHRLSDEGLFDEERKKPIPAFPDTVGVVTSPTGAAIRDIINVLERRAAGIRLVVFPTLVQGEGAASAIAGRIEQANKWSASGELPLDVLIVGRGGGAFEDLLAFSDEAVVRAVAASKLPVISAVGHEIDSPLCDFAADLRAPTPSAAAELVSGKRGEALDRIHEIIDEAQDNLWDKIDRARILAKPFSIENLERGFRNIIQPYYQKFDDAKEAMIANIEDRVAELRRRFELATTAIEAASPLAILERGFAVVTNERSGKLLRRAKDAKRGDPLSIRLLEGTVKAVTEEM